MTKLCGNCSGDHKYSDCPYTERLITKTEWEQNQKLRELIEKEIEKLGNRINKEEKNLRNVTIGFKEMTYRMIEKDIEQRLKFQKLLEESKN